MQVDVDKTVIIFVEFGRDHKLWHVDHEDVAIAVSELLCSLQALGGRHEAEHLKKDSWFQHSEVPLP